MRRHNLLTIGIGSNDSIVRNFCFSFSCENIVSSSDLFYERNHL
jgi:hypothetical protein